MGPAVGAAHQGTLVVVAAVAGEHRGMDAFTGWHVMVLLFGVLLVAAVVAVVVVSLRSRSRRREERIASRAATLVKPQR